jgi:Ca2+-binding EF-hand superfamily protein
MEPQQIVQLREEFENLDTDQSGFLEKTELKAALE